MTTPVLRGIFTAVSLGLGSCIGLFSNQTDPPLDTGACAKANAKVSSCFPGGVSGVPNDPSQCTGFNNCQATCFLDASCDDIASLFNNGDSSAIADCISNCL